MLSSVQKILEEACHLQREKPVLAAVSGGPDSLCLLNSLLELGYSVVAAHLNHGLRSEAGQEAETVRRFCQDREVPFRLKAVDTRQHANRYGLSIEEAARHLRYQFLFAEAQTCQAQAVAVAHTADDQVETVLMHLLRGAGLDGLSGMSCYALPNPWSNSLPLIRPLLGIWRHQISAYLDARQLVPHHDPSNQDPRFFRNRLRHELLPYLETYNPRIKSLLWQTAEVLQQDRVSLAIVEEQAWQDCCAQEQAGALALHPAALTQKTPGIQRRLLRRAISHLQPGLRDIGYDIIQQALAFLKQPPRTAQMDLAAGLRLRLEAGTFWITTWEADLPNSDWPQMAVSTTRLLSVPGRVELDDGWQIRARQMVVTSQDLETIQQNTDPLTAWLDPEQLETPLLLRTRHPGDRFQPLGLNGHSLKISDFMINQRLPRRARDGWPLLLSGNTIVWIAGLRTAHSARCTPTTRQVLEIRLQKNLNRAEGDI